MFLIRRLSIPFKALFGVAKHDSYIDNLRHPIVLATFPTTYGIADFYGYHHF
jgi:hypothetical protein